MADSRTIFADGIMEASVTYGVARLTLAQTGPDGKPVPAGQLVIPLVQLPAFANGLRSMLRQVESRVKEAHQTQAQRGSGGGADPEEGASPSVPGAFRFGH